jgi:DNA invertase Pin-like site-specific DNA recombinase
MHTVHTVLYARVSTTDQTISHQRTQAEAAGYKFDAVIHDEGVSGVSTRMADRPGGRRLLDPETGLRRGDLLVVRWVDRLGRNYDDVTETIRTLMQRGVVVKTIINAMTFDGATKDPIQMAVRDALIAFMAATAQAQAEATKEAQKAGIKAAREAEDSATRYRGRKPTFDAGQLQRTGELLSMGWTPSAIALEVGIPRATVYRIKEDPAKMAAALRLWNKVGARHQTDVFKES